MDEAEASRRSKGVGVNFYVANRWVTDNVRVLGSDPYREERSPKVND